MTIRSRWAGCFALAVSACGSCERPNGGSAVNVPPAGSTAGAASSGTNAARSRTQPPSDTECEALWSRYHRLVSEDPFVTHDVFVARCGRSEREVLTCPERTRKELDEMVQRVDAELDGGAGAARSTMSATLFRVAMPTRHAICMARERLRFAAANGELDALAGQAAAGKLHPDSDGIVVLEGDAATLPTRGFIEDASGRAAALGPFGETRMSRQSGGRFWFYFLGGMLGRHQNQVGFVYSRVPFAAEDFKREGTDERVCLERGADAGASKRYLLWCFSVVSRITPNLLEVGEAPD